MFAMSPIQIAAFILFCLGGLYFFLFQSPFYLSVSFGLVAIAWAAWNFLSILRGPDEVQSAGLGHSLAMASGVGMPFCFGFVMLMVVTPTIQHKIANLAGASALLSGAAGFGLGVSFTVIVMALVCTTANVIWWSAKR